MHPTPAKTSTNDNALYLPPVTVAVCVLNGEDTIEGCIASILDLDYPKERLSILVVDNGSTDNTRDILSAFPVEVIDEPVRGRGAARNRAWKRCQTPFIAFTDADCTVSTQWLKDLMPAFKDNDVAIVGGDIITPGDDILARFFELRQIVSNREFSGDYPYSPPFLATANALFRIEAIRAVDGFREHFRVAEDADICWRIQSCGYRLCYIPGGTVSHYHRTTLQQLFRQAIDYGHDGVHVIVAFRPEIRCWVWFGLYARWLKTLLQLLLSPFRSTQFKRSLPRLDLVRYTGLILGRIQAARSLKRCIL